MMFWRQGSPNIMYIGPCLIVIFKEQKTYLMSLAIIFHFLCAQHVSDINISIIRSLRLCCWITTSVVLFSWVIIVVTEGESRSQPQLLPSPFKLAHCRSLCGYKFVYQSTWASLEWFRFYVCWRNVYWKLDWDFPHYLESKHLLLW